MNIDRDYETDQIRPIAATAAPQVEPVVEQVIVAQAPAPVPAASEVYVEQRRPWPLSSLVGALVGAVLVIYGALALLRSDLGGTWTGQSVDVMGLSFSPLLATVAAAVGVLLLLGAAARSRGTIGLMGALLILFGIVVVIEYERLADELAVNDAHGWIAIGIGAALALSAALSMDRLQQTSVAQTHR